MAEIGPDQLVYVDRRNNVLKLAQGEFVAISRLESLYTNGHAAIRQVYLFYPCMPIPMAIVLVSSCRVIPTRRTRYGRSSAMRNPKG